MRKKSQEKKKKETRDEPIGNGDGLSSGGGFRGW